MTASAAKNDFVVWGIDQTAYGPVEIPELVSWVKDGRVFADTWVFVGKNGSWQRAGELPELQMFFSKRPTADSAAARSPNRVSPGALRRIKILGTLSNEQLEKFADFAVMERAPQWSVVVAQGDVGDSMYFVLDGELRVRMNVAGRETILATLGPGEFFGDVSLFDKGPRSADVVANVDSTLVRISASAVDEISRKAPDLAAAFLRAVGKTLTARIRADNKRHADAFKFREAAQ